MARRIITGLDYLPLDVAFFQDRKVRKLQRRCDNNAVTVYLALLCLIYKEGYYIIWDSDLAFDVAELLHTDEEYVNNVINVCVEVGLFDSELFRSQGIMTSAGIQRRYEYVCDKSKRKAHVTVFSLISSEENEDSSEETAETSEETAETSEVMQTSKVSKVSKVKKEKDFIEKEKILAECFFRNWQQPEVEARKIEAYNSGPAAKKKWQSMTVEEKLSIVRMWNQEPAQPPRFSPGVLAVWRDIYQDMLSMSAPRDVLKAATGRVVKITPVPSVLKLTIPRVLMDYLEAHVDTFAPRMKELLKVTRCKTIQYSVLA